MITVILILTAACLFFYLRLRQRYGYWERIGVQGPAASVLTGTYFSEFSGDGRELEKRYLNKYGPVFGLYPNRGRQFNTAEPEHIKQALSDTLTFQNFGLFFVDDKYVHRSLQFMNGARWKEHRSAITHHFTSRKLKSFLSHFETGANRLIANVEFLRQNGQTDVVDMRKLCKCYAFDMIAKHMFAINVDSFRLDQQNSEFGRLALRIGDVNLRHLRLLGFMPQFLRKWLKLNIFDVEPFDKLGDLLKRMVRERDPNLRYNDLIELLQDQIRDGKLKSMDEDDVIGNGILGLLAGTDTTSNGLTKVFYYLTTESEARQRLQEELRNEFKDGIIKYELLMEHQYLDAFVRECLRMGQSILTQDRLVAKDTQLGKYKLETGTTVNLITYLNHMSEQHFPDPEKFNADRWMDRTSSNPNEINRNEIYAPFSAGPRQCIGQRFALLEIKYLVARVLLEYDLFKPDDFKLEEVSGRRFANPVLLTVGLRKRIL